MASGWARAVAGAAVVLGATAWGVGAPHSEAVQNAQQKGAVLVELFTSEGCSSCPPADALLARLQGTQVDGARVIGLSEHVTYWNGLGWSDRYSSDAFTARQQAYAARFGLDSVYTPQMVINGQAQVVGSDVRGVRSALTEAAAQPQQVRLRVLADNVSGGVLTLRFSADAGTWHNPVVLMAVIVDDADRSDVLRGENSGRLLQHVDVARALLRIAEIHGDTEQTARIPLPASALDGRGAGHHLVLFAQTRGYGPVVGAITGPLAP